MSDEIGPMKIAIVAPSAVPFLVGGAEKLWWGLQQAINQLTPHHAELLKLPSPERDFWQLMQSYRAFSELDVSHFDLVISTKYPAWMVRHPNHICYLQHRLRGLYDTYHLTDLPTALPPLPEPLRDLLRLLAAARTAPERLAGFFAALAAARDDPGLADHFAFPGPLARRIVHGLDAVGLDPAAIRRYLAISRTVAERADYFPPGVAVEVLHHPSDLPSAECTGYQHLFTASRLDYPKRLDLIIKAFRRVATDRELRIAGTGPAEGELRSLAGEDRRIRFLGHISDAQIMAEYGRALFVPFVPYQEDYGLITLEAMRSAKPVLTTSDAGGVNELVEHGVTGLSVAPTPRALAAGMAQLIADPAATRAMGEAARRRVAAIDWPSTVVALIGETAPISRRPKIVVAVDFPVYPPRGGGQTRIFHLYRSLARDADCVLVTLCDQTTEAGRHTLGAGLTEVRVAKSDAHLEAGAQLDAELGVSVRDIATQRYQHLTPDYARTLAREVADCDLLICSHPYLFPTVRDLPVARVWYEAHNVELDMKRAVLGNAPGAEQLLTAVGDNEAALCARAERILVCAAPDAARLAELYGIAANACLIVPNGVDAESVRPLHPLDRAARRCRLGLAEHPCALFIGSWHQPNIVATEALKEIARTATWLQILVVGSVTQHEVLAEHPTNLYPLGVLEDNELDLLLGTVDLALNPVESGSGTNLKMLHYAAAGIPILTTPFGNRGLRLQDGEHLWEAPLSEFARRARDILATPPEHREARTVAARRLVETEYDWTGIAQRLWNAMQTT